MTRTALAIFLSSTLAASACSPHKVTKNPAPPIELPETYVSAGDAADMPNRWWESFGDATLNHLVETALSDNLQVKAAFARVEQAQAVAKAFGAPLFPQLTGSGSYSRQQNRNPLADFGAVMPGAPAQPRTYQIDAQNLSLAASYEIDIFKKLSNNKKAAAIDAMAARDQAEAMAISLVAQIADSWFLLITQKARLKILEEQVKTSEDFLELAQMRLGQGLGSSLDMLQQQQQLEAIKSQRFAAEATVQVLTNQLAVLVGKAPGQLELEAPDDLPALPPRPGRGLPADLLDRRPDVRAARRLVESADYRVAVAVANRLPGLRLTGQFGYQSTSVADLFKTNVWNIVGAFFTPIFDGGRLKAEVKRNEALVKERSYNYGQVLLQAIVEVENAIVQENQQLTTLEALEGQYELAQQTLTEARARYSAGLGNQSFIQVLSALSAQQNMELAILQSKRQALAYRIQLCRALGGGWTRELNGTNDQKNEHSETGPTPTGTASNQEKAATHE